MAFVSNLFGSSSQPANTDSSEQAAVVDKDAAPNTNSSVQTPPVVVTMEDAQHTNPLNNANEAARVAALAAAAANNNAETTPPDQNSSTQPPAEEPGFFGSMWNGICSVGSSIKSFFSWLFGLCCGSSS